MIPGHIERYSWEPDGKAPGTPSRGFSRRHVLRGAGVTGLALATGSSERREAPQYELEPGPPIVPYVTMERQEVVAETDLLRTEYWQMAGARITRGGMLLTPTGLAILNKREGNRYDPNLTFNVRTFLDVEKDFKIGATLQSNTPVHMQLYGQPPIRFDDFNYFTSRVEMTAHNNALQTRVWDGSSQTPAIFEFGFEGSSTNYSLGVVREGDAITLIVNNTAVGRLPNTSIFDTNRIWLGFNSEQGQGLVSSLRAQPLGSGRMHIVDTSTLSINRKSPPGLQTFVTDPNFSIGTAASLNQLLFDEQYAQLVGGGNFDRVTTENEIKPQDVQPQRGLFTFERADAFLALAKRLGLKVRAHALVYTKANPQWMQELPVTTAAERRDARDAFTHHVHTVASFLNGRADIIDVVNEVVAGFMPLVDPARVNEQDVWYRAFGGEHYIDEAFHTARAAAPDAKLYLNEFGIGHPYDIFGRATAFYDLVERLKQRGVPIDGVGFEGHIVDKIPLPVELPFNLGIRDSMPYHHLLHRIEEFRELGVDVEVTELDIPGRNGTQTDIHDQAKQGAQVAGACIDARNCTGLTVWGANDTYGSRAWVNAQGELIPASDLLYDANFRPKAVKYAIDMALLRRR